MKRKLSLSFKVCAVVTAMTLVSCSKSDSDSNQDSSAVGFVDYQKSTSASSASLTHVFEYTPAPGQFINEWEEYLTTPEGAAQLALTRINSGNYVSLGGFGGYIVIGFDHDIPNRNVFKELKAEYDFAIKGNSFEGSSEPGIVYVMQDDNGNGKPDDIWYQLKGAECEHDGTIKDYEVTYFRPANKGSNVEWKDNKGKTGFIDYIGEFHSQSTYFPTWIKKESYTLKGICLESNVVKDANDNVFSDNHGWGYADNYGDDMINKNTPNAANVFRISNAVDANGNSVNLAYINFVKIQCAVNDKGGAIGEMSTEVFGAFDMHIVKESSKN